MVLSVRRKPQALFLLKLSVFLAEPFNTAGRVDQFLFAGKKWMAIGANFHAYIGFGGPGFDDIAAGTFDLCFGIFWMNI